MIVDPAETMRAQLAQEKNTLLAVKRDKYIKERLRQIRMWNAIGWLFWILLAVAAFFIYRQKPIYLDPHLLSIQIQLGKMPSNELAQLAALGSLLFWGMIGIIAGFIFQIYVAMYSERKLIRLFETLHQEDLARYQLADQQAIDDKNDMPNVSDSDQTT